MRDRLNKAVAKEPGSRLRASSSPYRTIDTTAEISKQLDNLDEQANDTGGYIASIESQRNSNSRSTSHSRQLSLAANIGGSPRAEHSVNLDNGFASRFSQSSTRPSIDSERGDTGSGNISSTNDVHSEDTSGLELEKIRRDYELGELRRQEEVHAHMERIDALQAKLQYLAREAAEAARAMANSSSPGSAEKKLAEKDEQIALLMEEGQTLSKTELKNMNTIKMLRGKRAEDERAAVELRRKFEKSERERLSIQEKYQKLQVGEKAANDRLRSVAKSEKELETLRLDQATTKSTIAQLQSQLTDTSSKASETERKAQAEALRREQAAGNELRDDLSNLKIEKELSEERLRAEIRQLKGAAQRDREHAQATEMELRGEYSVSLATPQKISKCLLPRYLKAN
jgi:DNA repair exonuclease SbcCD ATPase subunit